MCWFVSQYGCLSGLEAQPIKLWLLSRRSQPLLPPVSSTRSPTYISYVTRSRLNIGLDLSFGLQSAAMRLTMLHSTQAARFTTFSLPPLVILSAEASWLV